MKSKAAYVVRLAELTLDTEAFEFVLEDSFFQDFKSNDWETGTVDVIVNITRRTDGITLDLSFSGSLKVVCDRCLDAFNQVIESQFQLFMKFGEENAEVDDNLIIIPREENQVNLAELFYEYLVLSLPIQRIHPDKKDGSSGCDSSMIERLGEHMISEEETKEETETDPRWDELKKLMDKK